MRFGCVTAEPGRLAPLAAMGYDFAELSCRALAPLRDTDAYDDIKNRIAGSGINVESLSGFIPHYVGLMVVGPDVDRGQLRRYSELVIDRAGQIGAKIIVFGSGPARQVPDGFDRQRAMSQLREFLTMCGDFCAPRGITFAIEPLNRSETNTVNTLDEAVQIVKAVGRQTVRIAVDYYHLLVDQADLSGIDLAKELIVHAHTADADRQPPGFGIGDQRGFLTALLDAGYDSRVAIECRFEDFEHEAPVALGNLRNLWSEVASGR